MKKAKMATQLCKRCGKEYKESYFFRDMRYWKMCNRCNHKDKQRKKNKEIEEMKELINPPDPLTHMKAVIEITSDLSKDNGDTTYKIFCEVEKNNDSPIYVVRSYCMLYDTQDKKESYIEYKVSTVDKVMSVITLLRETDHFEFECDTIKSDISKDENGIDCFNELYNIYILKNGKKDMDYNDCEVDKFYKYFRHMVNIL